MIAVRTLPVFLLFAALALIGSGCDSGVREQKEKAAIRAVSLSPEGFRISQQFPATPKSVHCNLNMGGPAPGIRVSGTCATIVSVAADGSAVVGFRQTWDSHDFIVNARARGELMHTWDFTVAKDGHISSNKDYGAIYSAP